MGADAGQAARLYRIECVCLLFSTFNHLSGGHKCNEEGPGFLYRLVKESLLPVLLQSLLTDPFTEYALMQVC